MANSAMRVVTSGLTGTFLAINFFLLETVENGIERDIRQLLQKYAKVIN